MVPTQVFNRIFNFHYKDNSGTCFLMEFEDKQYLITAKHIIENIRIKDEVEFIKKDELITYRTNLIGHSEFSDISVLSLEIVFQTFDLEFSSTGIIWGQDLYFLGYPYYLNSDIGSKNRGYNLPFIKKGIFSALNIKEPGAYFLIDGINNPGFSGGPVVFKDFKSNNYKIAGVIASYIKDKESVFMGDAVQNNMFTNINTGIIKAYSIENAIKVIKENPNGIPIYLSDNFNIMD